MAASIIFLGAGTRRVFPAEIFLTRDVAQVSAMFIVSGTSSICSSLLCWCVCGLVGIDFPEKDCFVGYAAVLKENSFIDGTKGFVQALVVCCGTGVTFAGSGILFWIVLVLNSLMLVLGVWYLLPLVPRWLRCSCGNLWFA